MANPATVEDGSRSVSAALALYAGLPWEAVYGRIVKTVTLVAPSGPVAEFLLHIDGDEASFRWSDEPFSEV